jgi:hypothetical protein
MKVYFIITYDLTYSISADRDVCRCGGNQDKHL